MSVPSSALMSSSSEGEVGTPSLAETPILSKRRASPCSRTVWCAVALLLFVIALALGLQYSRLQNRNSDGNVLVPVFVTLGTSLVALTADLAIAMRCDLASLTEVPATDIKIVSANRRDGSGAALDVQPGMQGSVLCTPGRRLAQSFDSEEAHLESVSRRSDVAGDRRLAQQPSDFVQLLLVISKLVTRDQATHPDLLAAEFQDLLSSGLPYPAAMHRTVSILGMQSSLLVSPPAGSGNGGMSAAQMYSMRYALYAALDLELKAVSVEPAQKSPAPSSSRTPFASPRQVTSRSPTAATSGSAAASATQTPRAASSNSPVSLPSASKTPTPYPTPSSTSGGDGALVWQEDMLTRVNALRASTGAAPLVRCGRLERAAQAYSAAMSSTGTFAHTGADGSSPWTRIAAEGYGGNTWGENIAMGQGDVTAVMASWTGSSGHYANMVNKGFMHVGFGKVQSGGPYWTQDFGAGGDCGLAIPAYPSQEPAPTSEGTVYRISWWYGEA